MKREMMGGRQAVRQTERKRDRNKKRDETKTDKNERGTEIDRHIHKWRQQKRKKR